MSQGLWGIFSPHYSRCRVLSLARKAETDNNRFKKHRMFSHMVFFSRVEDGRGSTLTPFPVPAHQTGRAVFPHPAFRPTSSQGTRRSAQMDTAKKNDTAFTMHRRPRESASAARRHLVTSDREMTDSLIDVIIDRPIGHQPRAIRKTGRPASQKSVQPTSDFRPGTHVTRLQDDPDLLLEAPDTFLRGAGPQIPMAALLVAVRAKRVAQKVKRFFQGILQTRLVLIQLEAKARYHRPGPVQGLQPTTPGQDHKVVRIGDDPCREGLQTTADSEILQKTVHIG